MLKIVLILVVVLGIFATIFVYFSKPSAKSFISPEGVVGKNIGNILGSSQNKKPNDVLEDTKDSLGKNVDDAKDVAYNTAKDTLNNVFNKQEDSSPQVSVNVLGVSDQASYLIDLSKDSNLNLNLKINTKYNLKFQNVPQNYCLYINNEKYPLKDGVLEIQFNKAGNFPIKANNCELNDKNIGNLTVN